MKNQMLPVPFMELVKQAVEEYRQKKSFFAVPYIKNVNRTPIGPAAGPHTQLAQNIVSAYAAGATVFELKTVQILEGEALNIVKPCIYVGSEVYNTEWSTELTVIEAANEYIKAAILIQVLSKEFDLVPFSSLQFVMSVGYSMEGITSSKVDTFIETMKDASNSDEWKQDVAWLEQNMEHFERLTQSDIDEFDYHICDTVTLSTMHGCPASDIEVIGKYLLTEKKLNTYIKMNPTLLGKESIERILAKNGYEVTLVEEMFKSDITLEEAKTIITACLDSANQHGLLFGVKLTNTLPVKIKNEELAGSQMYMSGSALYALSINTAKLLSDAFDGELRISYSGGADDRNIKEILETGIAPVTVSSFLLQPGGYKNISKLIVDSFVPEKIDNDRLVKLSDEALKDKRFYKKSARSFVKRDNYDAFCSVCHNCEDICPNRANRRIKTDEGEVVLHNSNLCNECGACVFSCVMGHMPYLEKAEKIEV